MLNFIVQRKHRVFALGAPKSGTTSIAGLFADRCRADHEPHRPRTVNAMYRHYAGELSDDGLRKSYQARDKQLLLDVESNCFLAYRPDLLLSTFPKSKYLITVREPKSWLDSIFDNNLNFPKERTRTMTLWHRVFFQSDKFAPTEQDKVLLDLGLYPLSAYLSYWSRTYSACLRALRKTRLLVVGTKQISSRKNEIGRFVGIDVSNVASGALHKNQTVEKHGILRHLCDEYLTESIDRHCRTVISEHGLDRLWV